MIKCPHCDSTDVEAVEPFVYIKACNNNKCVYYIHSPEKQRYQFFSGPFTKKMSRRKKIYNTIKKHIMKGKKYVLRFL